ncbi:hypothetical protein CH371_20285 [Leptospira wolffii]|uniref:Uncharacterized protein n=1 Tax=Leptospira wolffii TaxID=409998 RepID=A0A2M9Z6H7_9LEPT|nr:hypothetical protein [Leptospira wolffii]PJZ64031.1 hypothetical protein CH371_20285 [Leptospira wolffii]
MKKYSLEKVTCLLGILEISIFSNDSNIKIEKDIEHTRIISENYSVTVYTFSVLEDWLWEELKIHSSKGWMFYITKKTDHPIEMNILIELINPSEKLSSGPAYGQGLMAIEISDRQNKLHIGTEGDDALFWRAEEDDFMPQRLFEGFDYSGNEKYTFTDLIEYGFSTQIPHLNSSEKIYFHYIYADDLIRPSKDYPNEEDYSTWVAVDFPKKYLETKIRKIANDV